MITWLSQLWDLLGLFTNHKSASLGSVVYIYLLDQPLFSSTDLLVGISSEKASVQFRVSNFCKNRWENTCSKPGLKVTKKYGIQSDVLFAQQTENWVFGPGS